MPTGLALPLSQAGVIAGTGTVAGTASFTLSVTDAEGRTASRALQLDVLP
ncbi:MAG: hypothetical protein IT381_07365 [Deltaproteobacteria bacterium]|nr:hypothetical protein [Deltaproteobacteria bacterium]